MIYRVKVDIELFEAWRSYESDTGVILLSGLIQNDMFLPTAHLNEEFQRLHDNLEVLREKYSEKFISQLEALRDRTAEYIRDLNKQSLTDVEFEDFRKYCHHHNIHHAEGSGDHIHTCVLLGSDFNRGVCSKVNCPL